MTYEEALDVLMNKIQIDVNFTEDFNRDYDCLVKCKEALEKQIPKKQDKHFIENGFGFFCCKETGKTIRYPLVSFTDLEFCPRCGQKIDCSEIMKKKG